MDLKKIGRSHVVTIGKDASIAQAAREMRDNHVGDVVVVEKRDGKSFPVGVLTDRDIVMATIALGVPVDALDAVDVMTPALVTVDEHTSLGRVIGLMKENGIKRVPILGKHGELTGIVAVEDVMALLASEFSALSEVSRRERKVELDRRRKLA